jgi:Cu2+-exporting ATPase
VVLPVWLGAVLMSASTIIVAINAQTLRRLRLRESDGQRPALQPAPA